MNFRSALILLSLSLAGAAQANFNYSDFSSTAGLALNQDAKSVDGALRLTEAQNWQGGSAWTLSKQSITSGFDTSFDYHIGEGNGADGLTFALHDRNTWDLGGLGGSLGFDNLHNGYGVQFRTYVHNKIQIGGATDNPTASIANTGLRGDHHVRITYIPGQMDVYFDGVKALTANVDLAAKYGAEGAYVGFTSATGGSNDVHEIRNWTFKSGSPEAVPEPASMAVLAIGAVGFLRRRKKA